ncbi:MAG: SprB repeat-containing protein, partial [Bacteroidia bacterium]|nr:SprB repeat-containing protein [Bacteroidia bacterium]
NACESQSACNAMPICNTNTYSVPFTYTTSAPYNVNPGGAASCNNAVGGLVNFVPNWAYYRFKCFGAGVLNFTITPNDPLADMDWAIWDITASGCGTLNAGNIQACNSYNGTGATGMQPLAAAGFTAQISLVANHTYILGVSRKTGGLATTGYIFNFTGTTANINDNTPPALGSIIPLDVCNNSPITEVKVLMTKPIRCSGIQSSDFVISGNPVFTAVGAGCSGCLGVTGLNYSNLTDTVILNFPTPLPPNTYTLSLTGAPPAQPFFDICANLANTGPTLTFTIPNPLTLTITASKNCVTGQYTDTAKATYGTGPYQYKIAGPGQTDTYGLFTFGSNTFPGLIGGNTYTITVKDANNCTVSSVVNYPPNLPFNVITYKKNPPCYNQFLLDTFRVVSVSGGVAPFTYALTSTPPPAAAAANLYSPPASWNNLQPGQYTITVTDSYGCTATATANMPNPAQLILPTPASTNPMCFGDSTGTITCNATGGTPPVNNYVINPTYPNVVISGVNNNIFSNLPGGTYTITVTDFSGCTATNTKTLITPSQIVLNTTNTQPTCNNPCSGSISPISFGGTGTKKYYKYPLVVPPNTYSDSVVVVGGSFTNLCADTYTILAKDVLGCTTTLTVNLALPPLPNLTVTAINPPLCNGGLGNIVTNVTGGTGPYTNISYSFSPPTPGMTVTASGAGGTVGTYNNVPIGTYNLYINDANNCKDSVIGVVMTQPSAITWNNISGIDISCNGGNDGTINVLASGGTGIISYSISPLGPQTNIIGTFTGLTAQCYTITATDANGCTATTTYCLNEPTPLNINITNINNITCNGLCNGNAQVNASGGTPNYTYALTPLNGNIDVNTGALTNLCAGITYTITATDAHNCTITTTLLLTQPNIISVNILNTTNPTCNPGCDGTATTQVSGGTAPFTYTISGGANINGAGLAT